MYMYIYTDLRSKVKSDIPGFLMNEYEKTKLIIEP